MLFLYAESAIISSTSLSAFQINPYNCVLVRTLMHHMPCRGYLPVAFNVQIVDPSEDNADDCIMNSSSLIYFPRYC